jgi:hypothetical protein
VHRLDLSSVHIAEGFGGMPYLIAHELNFIPRARSMIIVHRYQWFEVVDVYFALTGLLIHLDGFIRLYLQTV